MAHKIRFSSITNSDSSSSGFKDDDITSEAKFELILDKFMKKTRPRPKVINGNPLWHRILSEHANTAWYAMKQEETCLPTGIDTKEWKYLNKEIFPTLLPAIEETMNLAKSLKVEEGKFRAFNYSDTLIHYMLNLSLKPGEPIKMIEDYEEIKEHLEKFPKPSLPKHKIWSRHKAATLIQKNVRGWLVRKRPEVFEMRQFWKVMREELKTRKGPVIPRPLIPKLSDILPSDREISSDTDGTEYIDEQPSPKNGDELKRLNQLKMLALAEKPLRKTHSKHKSISQREKSRAPEMNLFREATVQTERIIYRMETDRDKMNPFEFGSGSYKVRGSNRHKRKQNYEPTTTKQGKQKPEISQQDIKVAISFEDIKTEKIT